MIEIMTEVDEYIKTEIARFNMADAAIAEMRERFMPLIINGVEDKEGYKVVRESRLLVKNKRIEVERTRKILKEDSLKVGRAIDAEAKRITALLEPIEEHLEKQEAAIDAEKERIKAEQERIEHERIQGRMAVLMSLGIQFTGFSYAYGELSITTEQLKGVSDEFFAEFCGNVKRVVEAERLRLEAIEKAKEEERQRQEAEIKAEQERLAKIKAEQDEIARIQAEKDETFAAEKAAFEAEKRAAEEARLREDAEKKRLAEEEQARKEAEENAKKEAEEKAKKDEEVRLESERQIALRAEKEEELRPDREKLNAYADKLEKVTIPKIKAPECIDVLHKAHGALTQAIEMLREGR